MHRGVYCTHTGPLTFESRCAAALAACGAYAALTGMTALLMHGMRRSTQSSIHIVVPHSVAAPQLHGVIVTRSTTLSGRSVLVRRGLPVLRAEHAAVDAALARPSSAADVMTAAVQQGLTTAPYLRAAVFSRGRVNGRRALLQICYDIEGGDRSSLERQVRLLIRRARLAAPSQNHPLRLQGRRVWLDMCYPELRIAIEIDGKAYHVLSEDWEADLDRQNEIALDGWLILRLTARVIRRSPEQVVARIRRAIAVQSALLVAAAG